MSADRKFRWDEASGQFVNRVSGEAIPDDEPVIIFRARDVHSLAVLKLYRELVGDAHHGRAVQDRIDEFEEFQQRFPTRLKEPGISRDILLNAEREDG